MDSACEAQINYLNSLRELSQISIYEKQVGKFLITQGYNYPDSEEIIELFLDYAELTQDFENIFSFMIQNQVGRNSMAFYHFFFHRLKQSNPNLAFRCIQQAKIHLYQDFNKIDLMKQELNDYLESQLRIQYLKQNLTETQIQDKLKQFLAKKYQSKNKKILIDLDNECRSKCTGQMIMALKNIHPENKQQNQNQSIFNQFIQNPEENECEDLLKVELPQPIKIFKNPSPLSMVTVSSEYIDKMPTLSFVSQSSSSSGLKDIALNSSAMHKHKIPNKLIIEVSTCDIIKQKCFTEIPRKHFDFSNIPKIRSVLKEDLKSLAKEKLLFSSPDI